VKLDLLYELQAPKPWGKPHPYGQREAEQKTYFDAIEQVKLADKLGYGTAWFVEHHFREGRSHCPAPEVVIGALSQVTENIRLGFGVTLTPHPFRHPVLNAERIATADIVSRGRIEWGTGRSTPMERIALGVKDEDSRAQWQEAIEVIVKMWESERFAFESEFMKFPALPRGDWEPPRAITPKPYQDPHPPCWQAASSEKSAVSAGEHGLGLLSFALLQPVAKMADHIRAYRTAQAVAVPEEQLTRVKNDRVGVYTLVHCYDDADEARAYGLWESVNWWYRHLAEFTLQWELAELSEEEQKKVFPLLEPVIKGEVPVEYYQNEDMIVIGTPEECLQKILRYESVGVDELLCYVQFGDLPHDKVMRNLELLAKEVMPRLEERGHRVDATARI